MLIIGEVDRSNPKEISGWVRADFPVDQAIRLYIENIHIRSHRADRTLPNDSSKRGFLFRIGERLLNNLPEDAEIRLVLEGNETEIIPFALGVSSRFPGKGCDKGKNLISLFSRGFHIDHWGNLQISFGKKPTKIDTCVQIYSEARSLVKSITGKELYVTGGNLLGLIREGKFLDHDDDIDSSLIFNVNGSSEAVNEFFSLVSKLAPHAFSAGLDIKISSVFHFYLIKAGFPYLDVLCGWFTPDRYWYRPSGYGGQLNVENFNFEEIDYLGKSMAIPVHYEQELFLTYGEGWRVKDSFYSKNQPRHPLALINKLKQENIVRVDKANKELTRMKN